MLWAQAHDIVRRVRNSSAATRAVLLALSCWPLAFARPLVANDRDMSGVPTVALDTRRGIGPVRQQDRLFQAFPQTTPHTGALKYPIWFVPPPGADPSLKPEWIQSVRLHFANQLTCYAFEVGGKPHLEIKGFSSGRIIGFEKTSDHVEVFASIDEMIARLNELQTLKTRPMQAVQRRAFNNQDGIAVVVSESSYQLLKTELEEYAAHLAQKEGRKDSVIIRVPDDVVRTNDPRKLRQFLKQKPKLPKGIFIVGSDIKPFEIYSSYQGIISRGTSDLPFGDLSSSFWDGGKNKNDPSILNTVYFSNPMNTFQVGHPTPVAFDMNAFAQKAAHKQTHWVSRWLSASSDPQKTKQEFRAFLERRKSYQPAETQNIVSARGGDGILYNVGDDPEVLRWHNQNIDVFTSAGTKPFDKQVLIEADFKGVVQNLDRNATFLDLMEHGSPNGFGNVDASFFAKTTWLPDFVHIDACSSGAWAHASAPENSVLAQALNTDTPPIAISAFQAIKSMPTIGKPDSVTDGRYVFLSDWKEGQTLGDRQIEAVNGMLESWQKSAPAGKTLDGSRYFQLLAGDSIFGAGEIER